jgi:hypothetical protein
MLADHRAFDLDAFPPAIMDKKDKHANAKRNRRRGPKLGPDAARRSAPPANG